MIKILLPLRRSKCGVEADHNVVSDDTCKGCIADWKI